MAHCTYPRWNTRVGTLCVAGWFGSLKGLSQHIGMYNDTHLDTVKSLTFLFPLVVHFLCDFILGIIILCINLHYLITYVDHGLISYLGGVDNL